MAFFLGFRTATMLLKLSMPVWGLLRTMMIPMIVPRRGQMGDQRTGTRRVLKASGEFGAGPSVIPSYPSS